jgi:hypothetical protein
MLKMTAHYITTPRPADRSAPQSQGNRMNAIVFGHEK